MSLAIQLAEANLSNSFIGKGLIRITRSKWNPMIWGRNHPDDMIGCYLSRASSSRSPSSSVYSASRSGRWNSATSFCSSCRFKGTVSREYRRQGPIYRYVGHFFFSMFNKARMVKFRWKFWTFSWWDSKYYECSYFFNQILDLKNNLWIKNIFWYSLCLP